MDARAWSTGNREAQRQMPAAQYRAARWIEFLTDDLIITFLLLVGLVLLFSYKGFANFGFTSFLGLGDKAQHRFTGVATGIHRREQPVALEMDVRHDWIGRWVLTRRLAR